MDNESASASSATPRESSAESVSMPRASTSVAKKNRASGKHSRGGCGTCKIRRVKCDETKPICVRCQKFGITCDGYQRQAGPVPSRSSSQSPNRPPSQPLSQFISEGSPLIKSSTALPSILVLPSMLLHNSEDEERYFSLFRDSTSFKISPSFEDDPVRSIILQACNRDSIRHAVIAIGALDQSITADKQHGRFSSDREPSNSNIHHKNAIRQYAQALAIMKKDVAEGRQDLRTTLLTCLVITLVESFHGNYALADAQINNGIELIRTWHSNHADASAHPLGFSSPAPSVIEDGIIQIFGRLQLQTLFWRNTRPTEVHLQHQDAGREVLDNMPTEFGTLYEARIYLELVIRRAKDWFYVMGTTYKLAEAGSHGPSEAVPLEWLCVPLSRLHVSVSISAVEMENHQRQRQLHLQDCQSWLASFEALLQRSSRARDVCGSIMLRLAYKAARLIILTSLVSDLTGLESATLKMKEIVDMTAQIYTRLNDESTGEVAKFSLDYPSITPLYFVGLNCRVRSIRSQAIQLMYASLRREGVVGSLFAAKAADWIRHIEEEHMDPVTGEIPEWARVTDIMMTMDTSARKADLVCKQVEATKFGLVKGEQRTVITW